MRRIPAITLAVAVASALGIAGAQAPAQRGDALRIYGLDPDSPLESRVRDTPARALSMFAAPGQPRPTTHALTEGERRQLSAAFAALPPLHRRILRERLRTVSFLDGMPNNALTSTVNPDDPYRLFDITIRAGILGENVSEFLTRKERTCFDTAGSSLSVSIEAGTLDALLYILIHEATHVVDASLELTPTRVMVAALPFPGSATTSPARRDDRPAENEPGTPFTHGIWSDTTTIAPRYDDPLLERIRFRTNEILPIDRAAAVYSALRRTPFASLYGSSNWHDDVAEIAALYHFTERLKQPYRIVLRDRGIETFAYEPMASAIVRGRFDQMGRFYEEAR